MDALRAPGNVYVAAGPGSGKTEFLAQKAAYLLQTGECSQPSSILAISFKRDAAKNLARRVEERVPQHNGRFVSLTFDAFTKGLVDRFGTALPPAWRMQPNGYDLTFWTATEIGNVLAELQAAAPSDRQMAFFGLGGRFLMDNLGVFPLPINGFDQDSADYPIQAWWDRHVESPQRPRVDFTMLNRLAEVLVRRNPSIARALRTTYPFVFIDEFQDTTGAQITFLESLFAGQATRVTAVGDRKQRIMRFAGAVDDAMVRFESVFNASHHDLLSNFRSSPDLVHLQHRVASEIEPGIPAAISQARADAGVAATIWSFQDERTQAMQIAAWIKSDIIASGRKASDFSLLAKQKIVAFESDLTTALSAHGIALRNDDARYARIALQDILKHEATVLALAFLRLSIEPNGNGALWTETLDTLVPVIAPSHEDIAIRRAADLLSSATSDMRAWMAANPLGSVSGQVFFDRSIDTLGRSALESQFSGQFGSETLSEVMAGLAERADAVVGATSSWQELLIAISAEDAVSLMTIHRSKGLEYHTVFVLGLDDNQWWSYAREAQETTSAFFVALSRAKQRLIISRATNYAGGTNTGRFYELLHEAGVLESSPQTFASS
ncbi:DNA helicase [Salinibacterium xinjiangense]|nr:DNA helicase [Salinibacterium xinjiangense]